MGCCVDKNKLLNTQQSCPHCGILFTTLATVYQLSKHIKNCHTTYEPQQFRNQLYVQRQQNQNLVSHISQNEPQINYPQINQGNSQVQQPNIPNDFFVYSYYTTNINLRQSIVEDFQSNGQKKFYWSKEPLPNQKFQYQWISKPYPTIPSMEQVLRMHSEQVRNQDFTVKQIWFRLQLEQLRIPWQQGSDTLRVSKNSFLNSTLASVTGINWHKEVKVVFTEEDTVLDAGGLLREWANSVIQEIINPKSQMFEIADTQDVTYKISAKAQPNEDILNYFRLLGIVIGKAIFERVPLNVYLDRCIIRHMLGQPVIHDDIYFYDRQLYQSWTYLLENEFDPEALMEYFVISSSKEGEPYELKPQGSQIMVNNQNKREYVRKSIDYYTYHSIKPFLQAFLKQLYTIIPMNTLSIFEPTELEMIIYGVPFIDLQDWKSNTEYRGQYTENHKIIIWFWNVLEEKDQSKLARFLQFCTGSQRTPVEGFKKLQSNRGTITRFCIESIPFMKTNPFPQGHTCFNRLNLPIYETFKDLEMYLNAILENDLEGVFGLE